VVLRDSDQWVYWSCVVEPVRARNGCPLLVDVDSSQVDVCLVNSSVRVCSCQTWKPALVAGGLLNARAQSSFLPGATSVSQVAASLRVPTLSERSPPVETTVLVLFRQAPVLLHGPPDWALPYGAKGVLENGIKPRKTYRNIRLLARKRVFVQNRS
jgi:hypothetical protein